MTTLRNRPDVRRPQEVAGPAGHRKTDSTIGVIATLIGAMAVYLFFSPENAVINFFGTEYVVQDLGEGWRLGMSALSAGIFGTWFAWISNRWSKLGGGQAEVRTTWWATAAVVALAIAMAFVAIWIF